MNRTLSGLLLAGIIAGLATVAFAQSNPPARFGPGGRGPGPRHPDPLVRALDSNHDGVISADEIANAPASLKALDANGDGVISFDELHPPRPADAPPPPVDAAKHHPVSPLLLALDANGDGQLSADEIANAATSLKALDTNHDGQLTRDELCPLPPEDAPPPRD